MPKVAKGRRKRAYRPKTRSGCPTCKIRRVKCDETRPSCLRCSSTGRICDGYPNAQFLFRYIKVPIEPGPAIEIHATPQSKRSFAFFVQRTCPQLAGFFAPDFWERLILQAAYHESAIRHAIVAIGSLHEFLEHQTANPETSRAVALEQHGLAIRDLLAQSPDGERGVDVYLITCILFTCFENMQGNHATAGSHIGSGAKLLCEILYDKRNIKSQHRKLRSGRYAPIETLARMFSSLDSQTAEMVGDRKLKIFEEPIYETMEISSFSDIGEAKQMFDYGYCLLASSRAALLSCDAAKSSATNEVHTRLLATNVPKFSLALDALLKSKTPSCHWREYVATAVLQLHVLSVYISLPIQQSPPDIELDSDTFMPQFKRMIELGEKVVSLISMNDEFAEQRTSFCLDMGYVIPLYSIASQCRDSGIRRKAIALLRSTSRQEGLWNSLLAAKAAERIMEIEENEFGGGADQVELLSTKPFFELDGKGGRLHYTRHGIRLDTEVCVVEELFSW